MRIKIWTSVNEQSPTSGPYRMLDIVERGSLYDIGEMTHCGEVVLIPPPIEPFTDDVDQSVIVKFRPASANTRPDESVLEGPPSFYVKIEFFPIAVDTVGWSDEQPLTGPYTILETENLTIENVSHLITPETFSLWKTDCFVSKDTADALEAVQCTFPVSSGQTGLLIHKDSVRETRSPMYQRFKSSLPLESRTSNC